MLPEREQAAKVRPDGAGKGLLPPALLPAFPAQIPASHRLQLLAQRKWLPAGAHSCFPRSVCCFQFSVPGSWIGTTQGEHCGAFPCEACLEENPSLTLGMAAGTAAPSCLPYPSLEGKPTGQNPDGPCGDAHGGRGQVAANMSPYPLGTGLAVGPGVARQGQETGLFGARGTRWAQCPPQECRAQPPGCEVLDCDSQKTPLQSLSKRDGCHTAPLEPRIGHEERGWRCPPPLPAASPPYGVPPGRGRGEQPNAFQISCKWLGRVIHIKLIKPLLVSRGRNPDAAVYLFWISPFFFFFFLLTFSSRRFLKGQGRLAVFGGRAWRGLAACGTFGPGALVLAEVP